MLSSDIPFALREIVLLPNWSVREESIHTCIGTVCDDFTYCVNPINSLKKVISLKSKLSGWSNESDTDLRTSILSTSQELERLIKEQHLPNFCALGVYGVDYTIICEKNPSVKPSSTDGSTIDLADVFFISTTSSLLEKTLFVACAAFADWNH